MRQVTDEGRNAVRGLRSAAEPTADLEKAFAAIPQEVAPHVNGEPPAFQIVVDGQRKPIRPFLRDDVYRIGREAVINAFRHSRAKNILVEVSYAPNRLRVLVRDDGCGIDPRIVKAGRDGHWGLPGMKERAERVGGHLRVLSSPSAGTQVELS